MKVTATRPTWVNATGGKTLLKKDQSAEVDGRQYRNHPFVTAGYLVVEEEPKPSRKPKKAEPEPIEDPEQAGEE